LIRTNKDRNLSPVTLLFFDRYNAEDPLFVADVGRRLAAAAKNGLRALVVHASDDAIERVREAYANADADSPEIRALVERAVRLSNQSITRRLIDEGVAAVSIQGCDRGLLHSDSAGSISTGKTEWLERTVYMGGVPVVSLLALDEDRLVVTAGAGAALEAVLEALAESWIVTLVYFTTNRKSALFDDDGKRLESIARDRLPEFAELPIPIRSGVVTEKASSVVVTNSAGLAADGAVSGTRVT